MTVRWRRAAQMLGPLLGRVAIHSWHQGETAWSLLVAREKPTVGMCRRRPSRRETEMASWHLAEACGVMSGRMAKALGLRREVGHMATSGLADVPEISRGKVWQFLQNRPQLGFGSFPKTAPVKIPEGRVATSKGLRQIEANISNSSQQLEGLQCIFSVLPLREF